MSEDSDFIVSSQVGRVTINSSIFNDTTPDVWEVERINENRLMLLHKNARQGIAAKETGFANCKIDIFKDLLIGLHKSQWSGCISIDTGYGIKKVYLRGGDFVFAGSNVIDDRLGEVIYRQGALTLDELTTSAAMVTRKQKFGQVLLMSGIFTNVDLYNALQSQVAGIIRSLFMVSELYFELDSTVTKAPTEVVFADGTEEVIHECYSYGCTFRSFLSGLRAESEISLVTEGIEKSDLYPVGSFAHDLVQLIASQSNVQELLGLSKLMDINTIASIAELIRSGICKISPYAERSTIVSQELSGLKAKIDAYGYIITAIKKAFSDKQADFPKLDLANFVASLNNTFRALYLDETSNLSRECVDGIFSQCATNTERVKYFLLRIESLIQFCLQVAGDNLEWETAKQLREEYRAIS